MEEEVPFRCVCDTILEQQCPSCQFNKMCSPDPDSCYFCITCDELVKYNEKVIRQAARAWYDKVKKQNAIVQYRYAITFTSPPGRTKEDILESLETLKAQSYVIGGTVGFELHANGAPHLHIALKTTTKLKQSNIKRINHGYNIQCKINKDVPAKWDNYIKSFTEAKKNDQEQLTRELVYWGKKYEHF